MANVTKQQIFESFISESDELLEDFEKNIIKLEKNPEDRELIDNIFRVLHSLKGNSSLLGLAEIKRFVHQLENLVDKIRNREKDITTHIINILLEAFDHMSKMFGRIPGDMTNEVLLVEEEEFIEQVGSIINPEDVNSVSQDLRVELLKFFSHPEIQIELHTNDALQTLANLIQEVAPMLLEDRRAVKTEEEATVFYKGIDVTREYSSIINIVAESKEGIQSETQISVINKNIDLLIEKHKENNHDEAVAIFTSLSDDLEVFYHDETGFDDVLSMITEDALKEYEKFTMKVEPETHSPEIGEVQEINLGNMKITEKTSPARASGNGKGESSISRQIKVDQEKLDQAISTAGEIVTVSEFFNYINNEFNTADSNIKNLISSSKDAAQALQELSDNLSKDLYDIRKVPIEEVLAKLPRIIRDEQRNLGKKARLIVTGEDEMVDKSIVAKLETVLVHMIRNSLDHGLEQPEERLASGKEEEGFIAITVTKDDTMMTVEVSDDGKGISLEKVRQKVIEVGLMDKQAATALSDREVAQQIFNPGLSTSDQVSETSGRGVGMDVVMSTIQEIGGNVDVNSQEGKGTSIHLRFPLTQTTIVKKGLAVAVGKSVFLIPIEMVMESFRPTEGEISTVEGKAEVINRRNEITSLVRLYKLFNIKSKVDDPYESILVMVLHKGRKLCFMVDSVIGQRQIIYKDLQIRTVRQPSPFEGVSVYDGSRLAMILNVEGIIAQAQT